MSVMERLRFAAKDPAGTDTHVAIYRDLCAEAAVEIERLSAARAKANNEWRLDYNKCADERDAQYLRAETAEAEVERLRTALRNVRATIAEDEGYHDYDTFETECEVCRAIRLINAALSREPQR